jgi:LysM repeat protein
MAYPQRINLQKISGMTYSKKFIGTVILACSLQLASAQSNYITHILKEGESLSALAQQYHTSVGDIMRINGMHADSKLVYGSKIKIPSTQKQAEAAKKSSSAVSNTPSVTTSHTEITHIVAKGETLYSISKKYGITVEQIKAWNNLTDESAKVGTLLIINEHGVNKLASKSAQKQKTVAIAEVQKETVATPVIKEPVIEDKPDSKPATAGYITDNIQPAMQAVNTISTPVADAANVTAYTGEGFFASQFKDKKRKDRQNVSGISKTFKTASGWADGKYYILANDIEPGTIVKITTDNGNSVYAKVLWNMGDMKENAGINFRVSNATAAALHESNDSFNLSVSF